MNPSINKQTILVWLDAVKDPEIPVLSIVDLGVITDVRFADDQVTIEMTPTFTGCPAIEIMKAEIVETLRQNGVANTMVAISFREPWSSDRISEKGRIALKEFGLAPPPASGFFHDLEILEGAACPRCDGTETELKTPFGSTLCRAIYYCRTCKESFEQFKPI